MYYSAFYRFRNIRGKMAGFLEAQKPIGAETGGTGGHVPPIISLGDNIAFV